MLDLRKLKTFQVAAATSNFTRAAAELGVCQASVSTHIKALEEELGVPLFERCRFPNSVRLTDMGRQMLEYSHKLLSLASEVTLVIRNTRSVPKGVGRLPLGRAEDSHSIPG
jgi:DNA-binding transcriptional LysR family regulator